ncbi:MAG: prephenate dehydrogenase/arogenate dehydrogenase family protein [Spirochaetes bacterium]|nr:prephenate dehydrogenase/arogenate dehydrogenase family protein [Spirochaetota bacterium]
MRDELPFAHIAVFGLGLLGGSLCLAVREKSPHTILSAYGRSVERLMPAFKERMVDNIGHIEDFDLTGVDLVVVATTVHSSIPILKNILDAESLGHDALVIDVGSVKEEIIKGIAAHRRVERFVGCHPMAGSEKKGYVNGRADLYDSSWVFITPHEKNNNSDVERIEKFWELLGAKTIRIDAAMHDKLVAYTSHLPHMVACVLVEVIYEMKQKVGEEIVRYGIGKGFKDSTRIAAGSEEIWSEIAALNANNIVVAIDEMIQKLEKLKQLITIAPEKPEPISNYLATMRRVREDIR